MAKESSFDIVSETDMEEVLNAINQSMSEIKQRYDFKGSKSEITLDQKAGTVTLFSDDDLRLKSVTDVFQSKLVKRGVSLKALEYGKVERASGDAARQIVTMQQGIPQDKAKEIVKTIKGAKLKVQAAIQGEQLRVSGKNKDDLQEVMNMLKGKDFGIDMQFTNYR